jgi:hypothetical protein
VDKWLARNRVLLVLSTYLSLSVYTLERYVFMQGDC